MRPPSVLFGAVAALRPGHCLTQEKSSSGRQSTPAARRARRARRLTMRSRVSFCETCRRITLAAGSRELYLVICFARRALLSPPTAQALSRPTRRLIFEIKRHFSPRCRKSVPRPGAGFRVPAAPGRRRRRRRGAPAHPRRHERQTPRRARPCLRARGVRRPRGFASFETTTPARDGRGEDAAARWRVRGDESSWTLRGDESRRRRGRDVDTPWRRIAAKTRPRRESSVETGRAKTGVVVVPPRVPPAAGTASRPRATPPGTGCRRCPWSASRSTRASRASSPPTHSRATGRRPARRRPARPRLRTPTALRATACPTPTTARRTRRRRTATRRRTFGGADLPTQGKGS